MQRLITFLAWAFVVAAAVVVVVVVAMFFGDMIGADVRIINPPVG